MNTKTNCAMNASHTPGKWAWQKFGTRWCLTGQHGMRPIVLSVMGGHLTSLVDGRLVSLMPDHPDAQLIALAPTLLAQRDALRAALEKLVEMHDESVFICGKDDERMVETLLESARAALAAEKAGA